MIYDFERFSIDTYGAYITRFDDETGQPIFFPKTLLGDKIRGGSHVCYPNFNPDKSDTLPQHGFGRTVEWQVDQVDDAQICLTYVQTTGAYTDVSTRIVYRYDNGALEMQLFVTNSGRQSVPVAPGFHPYFALENSHITIDNNSYQINELDPFLQLPPRGEMIIHDGLRRIHVSSRTLNTFVVWSDARDCYVCVEPTLIGDGFNFSYPDATYLVAPGETKIYDCIIEQLPGEYK